MGNDYITGNTSCQSTVSSGVTNGTRTKAASKTTAEFGEQQPFSSIPILDVIRFTVLMGLSMGIQSHDRRVSLMIESQ